MKIEHLASVSMTGRMYGWSKWGGAREGLVKEDLDEWYCQCCGEKQVRVLPSYMFPTDDTGRDFVRVCTVCKAKAIINNLNRLQDLLELLR
jgi:hypothetical protein